MTKTVEYRVIPINRWIVCRFEREDNGEQQSGSSAQRGEFPNEEMAVEIATMLAKADDGAVFKPLRKSQERKTQ